MQPLSTLFINISNYLRLFGQELPNHNSNMSKDMTLLRNQLVTDFFTDSQLASIFADSKEFYHKTSRLAANKEIIRLKRGFYVFSDKHRKHPLELFSIANHLYGPSYVSLESALSYYGLIPEKVFITYSVNFKCTKKYTTPIGDFYYSKLPKFAYVSGVTKIKGQFEGGGFLMATPEKALIDKLYLLPKTKRTLDFLTTSLRVELLDLKQLKKRKLFEYAKDYRVSSFYGNIKTLFAKL